VTDADTTTSTVQVSDELEWGELDVRAVNTARALAMDAVEKVGNGHPGTAMSLAPAAYLLYQRLMRHDPADPAWTGRDRFVLSAGHSSLTQYVQLYLSGTGLELADLQALRTWGSRTPGHPEYRHTAGVETTTGPLGQGLATAVGMAMAARRERGLLDPHTPPGQSPFDHTIWVIASDGDMQEGVTSEASSLAGHQELGNLVVVYDQNQISIEDDTDIALSEDTAARYAAYGWHVVTVDWRSSRDGEGGYTEDVHALHAALLQAKRDPRPSLVVLRTVIAWPAPNLQDTGKSHGSALGADEIRATKELMGMDPDATFAVDDDVLAHTRLARRRGAEDHARWSEQFTSWRAGSPERAALFDRMSGRQLPDGWTDALPTFGPDKAVATRAASGEVLTALADVLPELWGGSADLAGSNNTTMKGQPSFVPAHRATEMFPGHEHGRTLHFGIREHAMGAILNGIAVHGGTRPYGGTFLVFSDYMRPAVRLSALMGLPVTFVWTHDSVGLGEDGPTHQPVEHLAALRAIPGFTVVRPADANETAAAWRTVLERAEPVGLALSRQNLPVLDRGEGTGIAGVDGVARGAYVLREAEGLAAGELPDVLLLASGSEVAVALGAQEQLAEQDVRARVVSVPSMEWFAEQDAAYRDAVLPPAVRARVSVEAGISMPWHALVGESGVCVSLEHFGASASAEKLFAEFGFTPEAVTAAAQESLTSARARATAR
jgi:transketolase